MSISEHWMSCRASAGRVGRVRMSGARCTGAGPRARWLRRHEVGATAQCAEALYESSLWMTGSAWCMTARVLPSRCLQASRRLRTCVPSWPPCCPGVSRRRRQPGPCCPSCWRRHQPRPCYPSCWRRHRHRGCPSCLPCCRSAGCRCRCLAGSFLQWKSCRPMGQVAATDPTVFRCRRHRQWLPLPGLLPKLVLQCHHGRSAEAAAAAVVLLAALQG